MKLGKLLGKKQIQLEMIGIPKNADTQFFINGLCIVLAVCLRCLKASATSVHQFTMRVNSKLWLCKVSLANRTLPLLIQFELGP